MNMKLKIYGAVKIGSGKESRGRVCDDRILVAGKVLEDGYYECETEDGGAVVAVADGIGGCGCGFKAAEVALHELAAWDYRQSGDEDDLRTAFAGANAAVWEVSRGIPEYQGTKSTLSALVINGEDISLLHVGDSRIYHKRQDGGYKMLGQMTKDQNKLLEWQRNNKEEHILIPEEELKKRYEWNHLISYVGMDEKSFDRSMVVKDNLIDDGTFVLTTDGIHDFVDKEVLEAILDEDISYREKIEKLMGEARANGSHDDQSIIIVELVEKDDRKKVEE